MIRFKEAIVEVTKEMTFDSAHKLENYRGKCANLHGHTYIIQVTIKGRLNSIGMVLDFKEMKKMLEEEILSVCDHRYLNEVLLNFNPTAENMVVHFYNMIDQYIKVKQMDNNNKEYDTIKLVGVKLWETPDNFAYFNGESVLDD